MAKNITVLSNLCVKFLVVGQALGLMATVIDLGEHHNRRAAELRVKADEDKVYAELNEAWRKKCIAKLKQHGIELEADATAEDFVDFLHFYDQKLLYEDRPFQIPRNIPKRREFIKEVREGRPFLYGAVASGGLLILYWFYGAVFWLFSESKKK